MNINTLDLNLLKVFDALYRERNVSRAGERIGLAQSSMSNALSRLRDQFDDPLFQRTPQGMVPTQRAETLAPAVQQVLAQVGAMLVPAVFDPAQLEESVAIAASDLTVMTLAPTLMARLSEVAPGIQLNFVPLDKQQLFGQLDSSSVQLALGTFSKVPARFHRRTLYQDRFVCIARREHPALQGALTLESYTRQQHLLMTLNADQTGVIDRELRKLGHNRRIAMTCAQFSPLAEVVANTDLIATVPASLQGVAERAGCQLFPLPFEMAEWGTELILTQKFSTSELGRFLCAQISQLVSAEGVPAI